MIVGHNIEFITLLFNILKNSTSFHPDGLPNTRKVRNARALAFSNPDDEYEEARVFNMVTAVGHNQ